jgi:peroxiredoxin
LDTRLSGRDGLFRLIKSLPPTLKYEPGIIVAEQDVVIVQGRFSGFGQPMNWIAADIVRDDLRSPWQADRSGYVALSWRRLNAMRADIVAGAVFPDYELTDHTGKRRKLSGLQGPDPMILVLSRGGYCPKDVRQAEGLVQLHREMEVGYCRLVTISTDNMLTTNEYRTGVGAHWTFLSDPGRKVQKDLDIAEYTDPEHDPMIPHVIVLEPGLVVFKVYDGYWFFGRPSVEELRQDLRAVLRKCRPDWDITKPELKADWERGEHGRFYPYGKTYGQVFKEQE